jgi:hypothetical protein
MSSGVILAFTAGSNRIIAFGEHVRRADPGRFVNN